MQGSQNRDVKAMTQLITQGDVFSSHPQWHQLAQWITGPMGLGSCLKPTPGYSASLFKKHLELPQGIPSSGTRGHYLLY